MELVELRYFVAIYPRADELSDGINSLIMLANPTEKDQAHITIRGPYNSPVSVDAISTAVTGKRISVVGAGSFFEGSQNTVFLRCGAQILEKYWQKPDYPYNPHITIYDGPSRTFAEKILAILTAARPFFEITCGECRILSSAPGQRSLGLRLGLARRGAPSVGPSGDLQSVASMPEWQRLMYMERIAPSLNLYAMRSHRAAGESIAATDRRQAVGLTS